MKIEINQDQIDKLMVEELQTSYRIMTDDMIDIMATTNSPKHRMEDFKDQQKMRKDIKKVLSYYMVKEDFDAWVEETGVIYD